MEIGTNVENNWEKTIKTHMHMSFDPRIPLLGIYSTDIHLCKQCISFATATLINAKEWKCSKYPAVGGMDK